MKKKLLPMIMGFFFVTSITYAERLLTNEQARRLIEQYNAKEDAANAKIQKEEAKIEELKSAIEELKERITTLQAEIETAKAETKKEEEKTEKYDIYIVKPGDWLAKLAEYPEVYGKGNYAMWPRIYKANKDLIKDPTLIYPGWKLKIPRP
jgi:nucleoid-associated protein YgaU